MPSQGAHNNRAIGVTAEGVQGVDIITSQPSFTITRKRRTVTRGYFDSLCRLTGKTNRSEFWGFKRGELLYGGANGSGDPKGAEVSHEFRFAEDQRAHDPAHPELDDPRNTIAPDLVLTAGKRGWEYVWCAYQPKLTDDDTAIYTTPIAAYVEQVYPEAEFAALGLG